MKKRILKIRTRFWKILLALTGLSAMGLWQSCLKPDPGPIALYGVQPGDYRDVRIHGKVCSEDSLIPLPGIKVKFFGQNTDTVFASTDASGNYSLNQWCYEGDLYTMSFTDIDFTANHGSFISTQTQVEISGRDLNNGEHQADITLKPK